MDTKLKLYRYHKCDICEENVAQISDEHHFGGMFHICEMCAKDIMDAYLAYLKEKTV